MSIFNSKDKNTCGRPCQCETNTRTSDLPQTPYGEEAPKADTRDGRLTKITIEMPGKEPQVIEVHGAAITTIRDCGDKFQGAVGIFGNMCVKEVLELHDQALNRLIPELEKTALEYAADGHSLKDLVGALARVLEDM